MKLAINRKQEEVDVPIGWLRLGKRMQYWVNVKVEITLEEYEVLKVNDVLGEALFYEEVEDSKGKVVGENLSVTPANLIKGTSFRTLHAGKAAEYEDNVKEACQRIKAFVEHASGGDREEVIEF